MRFLNLIPRPGRYVGAEVNAAGRDWNSARVRLCLCFPDTYEVGMSNLGLRILYGTVNNAGSYLAERVFIPDPEAEAGFRQHHEGLWSLESRHSLRDFDLIGVGLASELSYTNLLTLLSLAGLPRLSKDRTETDPIVLAGGNGALTPEPLAPFVDAFFMGEADTAILGIMSALERIRGGRRREKLLELARLEGVYVPAFYRPEYDADGDYLGLTGLETSASPRIRRVTVSDLEAVPFPTDWLVPYLPVIHDRVTLEIMRGCVHRCLFCQARVIYGPCRVRSPEKLVDLADRALLKTGYEEISLLSLSSGDYPRLKKLLAGLRFVCEKHRARFSFPSLRVDSLDLEQVRTEFGRKPPALTFAPESSEACRFRLGKRITDAQILEKAAAASQAGWRHLKLYFMLGLPGEEESDLRAIVVLIRELSRRLAVNVSFNTFIPKPYTPLERADLINREAFEVRSQILRRELRGVRSLKLDFHAYEQSRLEALLCRGDRRVGRVIEEAWENGCRFDAYREHFHPELWEKAWLDCGLDPDRFLFKQSRRRVLPWNHIVI
ncbi:MAG TPA: TIGR03960 family B12-binding radical SAM protein [bacterium]|uniref:Ribosomal protein S12 methylthiotransferase RimO n=1 Tax=candidate division TA06 bacterium ADurb.Bin417 TaxID=1852828 RepID=A0A1V5MK58_UNCT6|nr:MAG: Ribosomal protein S12 methylthiotransferase RimO [candidate division TA06 bacterium ADurb.Bin417]HNQ35300.1 TIGR03960 family B12-binding radical SAM protein [bacterium]HNS48622.1 TIGR03960 family B12-binding radical SAM protein [bacterium]